MVVSFHCQEILPLRPSMIFGGLVKSWFAVTITLVELRAVFNRYGMIFNLHKPSKLVILTPKLKVRHNGYAFSPTCDKSLKYISLSLGINTQILSILNRFSTLFAISPFLMFQVAASTSSTASPGTASRCTTSATASRSAQTAVTKIHLSVQVSLSNGLIKPSIIKRI